MKGERTIKELQIYSGSHKRKKKMKWQQAFYPPSILMALTFLTVLLIFYILLSFSGQHCLLCSLSIQ